MIDFDGDDDSIRRMLAEGRRVVKPGGRFFVAFYRLSPGLEFFLQRLGLLDHHLLRQRECLESYLLKPAGMIRWVGKRARIGPLGSAALMLRLALSGTLREKTATLKMQRIVRGMENPQAFIEAAPGTQPYRNEAEIRRLFDRQAIPIKELRTLATCWMVQIGSPSMQSKVRWPGESLQRSA